MMISPKTEPKSQNEHYQEFDGESLEDMLALAFCSIQDLLKRMLPECNVEVFDLVCTALRCFDYAIYIRIPEIIAALEKEVGGRIEVITADHFVPDPPIKAARVYPKRKGCSRKKGG